MIQNFFICRLPGDFLYFRSYTNEPLDPRITVGFFSSMTSFVGSFLNDDLQTVSVSKSKFTFCKAAKYWIVAHSISDLPETVLVRQLNDVKSMLVFLFGDAEKWEKETLVLSGFHDVIDHIFSSDRLSRMVGGYERAPMDKSLKDVIERLLLNAETLEGCTGAAFLGNSVVVTKCAPTETRLIAELLASRSTIPFTLRIVPVFVERRWHHLVISKQPVLTLTFLVPIRTPLDKIMDMLQRFENEFNVSDVEVPLDLPAVQLRHVTQSRDVIALVYHNTKDGTTITPQLRVGPSADQSRKQEAFLYFIARANRLAIEGANDLLLTQQEYTFYALVRQHHVLFVLYTNRTSPADAASTALDILQTITKTAVATGGVSSGPTTTTGSATPGARAEEGYPGDRTGAQSPVTASRRTLPIPSSAAELLQRRKGSVAVTGLSVSNRRASIMPMFDSRRQSVLPPQGASP
eukprot:TRINITY_DN15577_c0_g1_i1.p1 TRINITY_DN15577_c0_g1~~TRINITY_DN15577_c0_g1_i1.p1  ORF type:complete len:463 (+),score=65.47 TRINITY_DN15577_c0_g1_i1:223-1611(+)